jgi:hypothetical protein
VASVIDPDQPLLIYVQLKTLLLEEILSGAYGSDRALLRASSSDGAGLMQLAVADYELAVKPHALTIGLARGMWP